MQFKQCAILPVFLLLAYPLFSQTTWLPPGDKANFFLERLEILRRTDSALNFSKVRPYSRQGMVVSLEPYSLSGEKALSRVDAYNLRGVYYNNQEWLPDSMRKDYTSRKPLGRTFFRTPSNLFEVHQRDLDLVINPVLQFSVSKESGSDESLFLNTRGVYIRGKLANRIGFYSYITDNQERTPSYVRNWVTERRAVPNHGLYKGFGSTGYDYFEARGYITFNATRYINVGFGYDRNFIGNGVRSLLLSDFGANALFLKFNTRIWKFNYQNLFMELHTATPPAGTQLIPRKYAALHHLDLSVTRWLNIGLFEGVVFGRTNRFDFSYLNPVIFYRSVELNNGSF
ncbi:MAG: hypothetical protein RJA57_204, partial [Bacteroidota bacterium]